MAITHSFSSARAAGTCPCAMRQNKQSCSMVVSFPRQGQHAVVDAGTRQHLQFYRVPREPAGHRCGGTAASALGESMQQPIDRVRGFADTDIDQYQRSAAVRRVLQGAFSLAGYQPIDVPVLEFLELYMRKSGAQVLSKLYGFTDQGRRE